MMIYIYTLVVEYTSLLFLTHYDFFEFNIFACFTVTACLSSFLWLCVFHYNLNMSFYSRSQDNLTIYVFIGSGIAVMEFLCYIVLDNSSKSSKS